MRIGNRVVTLVAAGVLLATLPQAAAVQARGPSATTNPRVGAVAMGATSSGLHSISDGSRMTAGPTASSAVPDCTTAVAPAKVLPKVRTNMVTLAGPPFGIAVTRDSRWSFVADDNGQADVVANSGSRPRVVHTIPLPQGEGGDWLTRDGRYLLVANLADGATVVSAPLAEAGSKHAVLGTLKEPTSQDTSGGSIEVTTSPDDRFAFVSIEYSDVIAVYDLKAALANGFHRSTYIGSVPLGQAVVGMAVSPNGRWLYATSETAADGGPGGTLSVISLSKAESHPASAVITNVPAECSPVRVVVSSNGKVVWVTARESDLLLAFDATKLRTDPTDALLASVRVGESPVGLALVSNERRIVVADSNRFAAPGASSDLTVVNTAAALAHKPAVLGKIHAGSFPREETLEPNGKTLLVGNYGSNQLETVSISTLP